MGFGNGYSPRFDRGSKRHNNDMVAHVWNAQSEDAGQSGNGNFYFRGAALYSYGSHYVVGFIMPDGVAFLNADSNSVTTNGHRSDARSAIRNRRHADIAGLTDLAGDWKLLPKLARYVRDGGDKAEIQRATRAALHDHAPALESPILAPGQWGHDSWDYETTPPTRLPFDRSGLTEAGAYLADLAGLPAAAWPKIKREAAKARAKVAANNAKAEADAAERRALRLSDMPARAWREYLAETGTGYSADGFDSIAKELRKARKLAMAATRGKLASKGRLATIRARLKAVVAERDSFDAKRQPRLNRRAALIHLATVRNWRDASAAGKAAAGYHDMRNLERAAQWLAERGRTARLRASAATLATAADDRAKAIATEAERLRELERVNRAAAEAERKAAWLRGEPVGRVNFDAETGGAAMRIVGDVLETSHGASVPLAHAVKAFRFVKLCRERGEAFHRNGRTVRVGHFQIDSISPTGDFVAGCHRFTWPEIERVARLAGVFDCDASADAIEPSHVAA